MKKYLLKIGIAAFLIAIIVVAFNSLCTRVLGEESLSDAKAVEKFQSVPESIDISNFGASHGLYGFNYGSIDSSLTCFNFSLTSQSPDYDCNIMRNYLPNLKSGGTAFLVISYWTIFGKDETLADNFESKNQRYYLFLPRQYIKNYSRSKAISSIITMKYLPTITANGTWKSALKELITGVDQQHNSGWDRLAKKDEMQKDAEAAAIRHINLDENSGALTVNEHYLKSIYEMIEMCQNKDITVCLVTTPYLYEYLHETHKLAIDLDDVFYSTISEITNSTGVKYYDYSSDPRFVRHYEWFMNSDHLNKEGAKQFTAILLNDALK